MKSFKLRCSLFVFLFFYIISCFLFSPLIANAEGSEKTVYSNVLDDLKKDRTFIVSKYPSITNNYSFEVIQIAEGSKGEVFVYVYQPSHYVKDLVASKINLSLQDPSAKNISYSLYDLELVSNSGVFDKYLVKGLNVSSETVRYYTVAAIYRKFDESIDNPALDDDDIKDYEGVSVGLSFAAYNMSGNVYYESKEMEVAEVEIQSVGYTEYSEGFKLYSDWCHSHFVAFSIENFDVNWVYDADIVYTSCSASQSIGLGLTGEITYGEKKIDTITISDKQQGSNDADGLFSHKYTWDRISKTGTFINEIEDHTNVFLTEKDAEKFSKSEFVFRFLETSCEQSSGLGSTTTFWTSVTEVSILRLHFLSNGKSYNLGVVSDIVSDDGNPDFTVDIGDNIQNEFEDIWYVIKIILGIIALVIICKFVVWLIRQFSFLFKKRN